MVIIFNGCNSLKGMKKKKEALNYLEEVYKDEFVIKKVKYINMNEVWEMTAAPKKDKDLEFKVRTGGMFGNEFVSSYSRIKLSYEADDYYKPVIEDVFGRKIYFYTTMATRAKFKDGKIPTFKKLLEYGSEDTYVNIFIFIFENVINKEKRKENFLANVMELLEYLRGQNLKWATIQIDIFDEEFFKDKDVEFILKETNYFNTGSTKLKYMAFEYRSYKVYGLRIDDQEFFKVKTLNDLESELFRTNKKVLRH